MYIFVVFKQTVILKITGVRVKNVVSQYIQKYVEIKKKK